MCISFLGLHPNLDNSSHNSNHLLVVLRPCKQSPAVSVNNIEHLPSAYSVRIGGSRYTMIYSDKSNFITPYSPSVLHSSSFNRNSHPTKRMYKQFTPISCSQITRSLNTHIVTSCSHITLSNHTISQYPYSHNMQLHHAV